MKAVSSWPVRDEDVFCTKTREITLGGQGSCRVMWPQVADPERLGGNLALPQQRSAQLSLLQSLLSGIESHIRQIAPFEMGVPVALLFHDTEDEAIPSSTHQDD